MVVVEAKKRQSFVLFGVTSPPLFLVLLSACSFIKSRVRELK